MRHLTRNLVRPVIHLLSAHCIVLIEVSEPLQEHTMRLSSNLPPSKLSFSQDANAEEDNGEDNENDNDDPFEQQELFNNGSHRQKRLF